MKKISSSEVRVRTRNAPDYVSDFKKRTLRFLVEIRGFGVLLFLVGLF
ncbi:MAG: hypothetical protein ACOCUU_03240 [Nanoarchaeota archaeon]